MSQMRAVLRRSEWNCATDSPLLHASKSFTNPCQTLIYFSVLCLQNFFPGSRHFSGLKPNYGPEPTFWAWSWAREVFGPTLAQINFIGPTTHVLYFVSLSTTHVHVFSFLLIWIGQKNLGNANKKNCFLIEEYSKLFAN